MISVDEELLYEIEKEAKIEGLISKKINPKALTKEEMFGHFKVESHSWEEGIFV